MILAKHFTIWIIGAVVGSNQYQLTKAKDSELLENVQFNSYLLDEKKVYSNSVVYDSVRIKRGNDTMFMAQYYQNGKALYPASEFGLKFSLIADVEKTDTTLAIFLGLRADDKTIRKKISIDDIEFDLYVSEWWSCNDPFCTHGHIQYFSRTFYCSEYGRLITISGTYGRAEDVDLLVGVENDTLAGSLVSKIVSLNMDIDSRIKEKYEEDRRKF